MYTGFEDVLLLRFYRFLNLSVKYLILMTYMLIIPYFPSQIDKKKLCVKPSFLPFSSLKQFRQLHIHLCVEHNKGYQKRFNFYQVVFFIYSFDVNTLSKNFSDSKFPRHLYDVRLFSWPFHKMSIGTRCLCQTISPFPTSKLHSIVSKFRIDSTKNRHIETRLLSCSNLKYKHFIPSVINGIPQPYSQLHCNICGSHTISTVKYCHPNTSNHVQKEGKENMES